MQFNIELEKPATNVLDPIIVSPTWAVGITAAAGTDLAQPLFSYLFKVRKSFCINKNTQDSSLTLACIGKFSHLLHPVGLELVSQSSSGGTASQRPYPS